MTERSSVASRILGAVGTLLGPSDSLENINTTILDDGCFCYVTAELKHYELHRNDTDAPSPPGIVAPIAGPGRWVPATGPQGAQGAQGFQGSGGGAQGAQGAQGSTGVQGSQGAQGVTGSQGAQGFDGAQGFQGDAGSQGAQGFQGTTGAQGAQGNQGNQGATGAQGFQGSAGAQGAQGFQGAQGNQGATGAQGAQGTQGFQGANAGNVPFIATYYVDPTFVGTSTGSASNPFTTIAAAFTFATGLGLLSALILLPPGINVTENVVFPTTGNDWEIKCQHGAVGTISAGITGTVAVNPAASVRYRLTEVFVTGLISGTNAGSSQLILTRVRNTGGMTMTGAWAISLTGVGLANLNAFNGSSGAVAAASSTIFAQNWVFNSTVTFGATATAFDMCRFVSGSITGAAAAAVSFTDCVFTAAPTTITDSPVTMDGKSLSAALTGGGLALAGAATLKSANSNASSTTTIANNVGSTALARCPVGLYEVVFDATTLVAGTAGALQVNIIYTDMTNTLVTAPVGGTLNIASAAGTKNSATLAFQHNGAVAAVAFSVTGIVTPGTMSVSLAIAIQRIN